MKYAPVLGYYWLSRSYYADSFVTEKLKDEVNIGLYYQEGGTDGEFSIKWEELCGKYPAKIVSWDDSWNALTTPEVVKILSKLNDTNPDPEDLVGLLNEAGFKDFTKYESTY